MAKQPPKRTRRRASRGLSTSLESELSKRPTCVKVVRDKRTPINVVLSIEKANTESKVMSVKVTRDKRTPVNVALSIEKLNTEAKVISIEVKSASFVKCPLKTTRS